MRPVAFVVGELSIVDSLDGGVDFAKCSWEIRGDGQVSPFIVRSGAKMN
jgi:hypothetical protein